MFRIKAFADYKVTKIEKGWSGDKKFLLEKGREKLLLRVSDINKYEQKQYEFETLKKLELLEIPTSRPIDFGIDDEGKHVWMVLTWVKGQDLKEMILNFSEKDQYNFGVEAGKILQKIHEVEIVKPEISWEEHFNAKINQKLKMYDECKFRIPGGEAFKIYIEENRHLLKGRPQRFHHGDYHIGNMILTPEENLIPIDFNRLDFGDPWDDFNRIVFCKEISPAFATGRVDGYFNGIVPDEFWRLLALYISSNMLSSLPWAIDFGEQEIAFMKKLAVNVLKDYDNMKTSIPAWYKSTNFCQRLVCQ